MDGTTKLIIAVVAVVLITIVAVVVINKNNLSFVEETKEETTGMLYFNIEQNFQKDHSDLKDIVSYYKDDFELKVKKGEQITLPGMYQKIMFTVSKIKMDDTVVLKSTMTFHYKDDFSDDGFKELEIKPNEETKILYFNGPDNTGFVTVRFEQ